MKPAKRERKETYSEWKSILEGLLNGVERELRSPVPKKIKAALSGFRKRMSNARIIRMRKAIDQEVEAFLLSTPVLQAAANRHIFKIAVPALIAANVVLERAQRLLAEYDAKKKRKTKRAK